MKSLTLALASLSLVSIGVQAQSSMPGMDHSKMNTMTPAKKVAPMPGMATPAAPAAMDHTKMDHGSMNAMAPASQPGADAGMAGMAGMDHGSMPAPSSTAPADARDPHAYSGGYTLETGPYALPGTRQLRLGDEHNFGSVMINRLERGDGNSNSSTSYDTQFWFGRDYDRLVIKAEGDVAKGKLQEARTEALWGHAIAPFWDSQLGVRFDSGGTEPERSWLALGVQGLAPYWFEIDAAAYIGDNGRTALRLGGEYEILLTQKLILQPRVELNFYGQDDAAREIGRGLSNGVAGIRLRYEINRQFAPYIGVERTSKFGKTADLARASGVSAGETRWVAGVRVWF